LTVQPFLLCDPGVLVPPLPDEEAVSHQRYWRNLVAWSNDRRLKLGLEGRAAVLEELGRLGWPEATPPQCPRPLCRDARKAIGVLLSRVVSPEHYRQPGTPSTFQPEYARGVSLGAALADDVCGDRSGWMAGAASVPSHWAEETDNVRVVPGPPDALALIHDPSERCEGEVNLHVAAELTSGRITIVGGKKVPHLIDSLRAKFGLGVAQIRWIESEKDHEPEVDRLKGANPATEIVFCLTGAIGHSGSRKTLEICRRQGVRVLCLKKASQIPDELRTTLGRC
jgi:hypothetical protein